MKIPDHINKIQPDADGLDFDALRKAGITLLQELSGENWTDYNLHDPGVTILEQFCYGLTDLAYRSEFAVEDYLAGPAGQIDFERHALHSANEIFPSQVLTPDDYRKILYDSIPGIEDVWIMPASGAPQPAQGLYKIVVKLDSALEELRDEERAKLERRIRQSVGDVFAAHRNLGEDLHEVDIVRTEGVFLTGDIQIHSSRDPAAIFADIFFRCSQQIASGFRVERYEGAIAGGASLEQLFSGPRTAHGYISNAGRSGPGAVIQVSSLIALAQSVDGVKHVRRLGLCDESGKSVQSASSTGTVARLQFPSTPKQKMFLKLSFSSSATSPYLPGSDAGDEVLHAEKARIMLDDARMELKKKRFEFNSARTSVQSPERIIPMPAGVSRPLRDYYSIQHQFPAIYGINRYGLPASASSRHQASARQLKAYLFLAEQLMANYLQNLHEIPRIFSVDDLSQSYFSQVLDDRALPGIEHLYARPQAQTGDILSDIVSRHDKLEDRRSRVIDVLLAMYGEEFLQKSLHHFNYYEDRHSRQWLIDNKLAFLRQIVNLSRCRASAFNYRNPSWDSGNVAGVHKKICILLGLKEGHACRSLTHALTAHRLKLISDAQAAETNYAQAGRHLTQKAEPVDRSGTDTAWDNLPASLLIKGIKAENYVLEARGSAVYVSFKANGRNAAVGMGNYDSVAEARLHVHRLRLALRRLNLASEGLHLVEHLLLRPRGQGQDHADVPGDFYAFRISVVFPSWTARFCDLDFRRLAEETVCLNLPAHIYPEFHWLDFPLMCDFEERYRRWLGHLRKPVKDGHAPAALNKAAGSLAKFLSQHRKDHGQEHWI